MLSTIVRFLSGEDWRLTKLDDIDRVLAGKSAATIKNAKTGELKQLYTRVQNQTIPINVLRCDLNKRNHNEYLFTIFHRLNSGGMKLNNQEIRNCIYSGSLNDALKDMDQNEDWRVIYNMQPKENYALSNKKRSCGSSPSWNGGTSIKVRSRSFSTTICLATGRRTRSLSTNTLRSSTRSRNS